MDNFFNEKLVTITNENGIKLEFFMRPMKVKELQLIGRITKLMKDNNDYSEFVDPILLELLAAAISIETEHIPGSAFRGLVDAYLEYNFPGINKTDEEKKVESKKEVKPLAFYIDFLVTQGYSISDIMELTVVQLNDIIKAVVERLNPEKKVMDPITAFRKMGIPIKPRGNN